MKEIQCSSGPTPPPEDSSGYGRGGFTPEEDYGESLEPGVKFDKRTYPTCNSYNDICRGGFTPGEDYGEILEPGVKFDKHPYPRCNSYNDI